MERFDFGRMLLVGLVLDISGRHRCDGQPLMLQLKRRIINLVDEMKEDIRIFVSCAECDRVPLTPAQSMAHVSRCKPDLAIDLSIKKACRVVAECLEDCRKVVLVVSDLCDGGLSSCLKVVAEFRDEGIHDYRIALIGWGDGELPSVKGVEAFRAKTLEEFTETLRRL